MKHPKKPSITISIGADRDTVMVDGRTFDRSRMTRPDRNKMTRIIVGSLTTAGYFGVAA